MPRSNTVRTTPNPADSSDTELSLESEEEMPTPPPSKRSARAAVPPVTSQEAVPVAGRRSTRVASQTVVAQPVPPAAAKKAIRSRTKGTKKKNDDADVADLETKMKKVKLETRKKVAPKPKPKRIHQHEGEYFNALPQLADIGCHSGSQLFVWGAGNAGQFGMGVDRTGELSKPTKNTIVEEMMETGKLGEDLSTSFVALAAGGMSSLFIDATGTVWSCGANDDAALGRITADVPHSKKKGAFADEDELSCNLYPLQSLLDEGFKAVQIAAGDSIGAVISDSGELRVWGTFRASGGVLGFSGGMKHQVLPIPVLDIKSKPGNVEKFIDVAAGNDHVIVVTTHGNIYTWGVGERGQLGRKVLERHKIHGTSPERIVVGSRSTRAIYIGAGAYTSFAVDEESNVWGWGANNFGQTGTGFSNGNTDKEIHVPKKVIGLSTPELGGEDYVTKIVGGDDHTLFLTRSGLVFACGMSLNGRLGLSDSNPAFEGRTFPEFMDRPALVEFPEEVVIVDISAGTRTSMAVSENGVLYMWGEGAQSELGAGKAEVLHTPTHIGPEGSEWFAVAGSCGGQHTLAMFCERDERESEDVGEDGDEDEDENVE
ncbi:regulator of chromosome condensation 1/beta-lactamase-inhibitor protein II [Irpex rosettiformis]|uniref:Regulator of chromosome condensation 1/beta-lactamase-inhibitor protein II n=1 Tax=Irpex rosettiformis TaxID=378272 RepID=A0ACB8U4F5_9APHY|nr:regulator of chromosome condensation 1/beta-lactamase-inhibitor protein II [Irpex rosettiformis]